MVQLGSPASLCDSRLSPISLDVMINYSITSIERYKSDNEKSFLILFYNNEKSVDKKSI